MTSIIADQPQATKVEPGQLEPSLLATMPAALRGIGADEVLIARATQIVATGIVYDTWLTGVREQGNPRLLEITESLGLVVDYLATGRPLIPLITAAERVAPAAAPGHHPWCVAGACRPERFDDGEVLTEHHGPRYEADVTDGAETIQLWAELGSDENFIDGRAQVFMAAGKADGLAFHSDELDKVINELGEFVDGLRHLRRVMDQGRAA
ncbi:DUF6907 domain-containing protein [Streptomyces antarcticus]|uniref:DUF6907 domain-containing protein n=1 Tax=Streptomyces antarcticus TaxID=2996458 RepID=UPI00226FD7CA|nr:MULTISPECIES: hypothetical protein [unclassified Streptomyces]MCY0943572.1 hypothetical protein [Streptomyces sp. H34-AA3]MCZ4083519.1 hypothetical protein [Streptomyces sp. H34-S5]